MKKVILTFLMFVGIVSAAGAQVDDVTLVVSGEGVTKDEAITKALRSAIEQAFGVFVSANTEILNDELVKDEIATVASGNVKKYTELGAITMSNGNTEVSLQVTVSVKKLTSYAQSHGSSAEFAGATFAANMKLVTLNKQNTEKAFDNMFKQIEGLKKDIYNCEIEVGMPRQNGEVDVTLKYYTNENTTILGDLIVSTLSALSIPQNIVNSLKEQGVKLYCYNIPTYYDEGTPLYYKGIEKGGMRYLYFYAPISSRSKVIIGQTYDIYDNLGNKYDFILGNKYDFIGARDQEEFFLEGWTQREYRGNYYVNQYKGKAIEIIESISDSRCPAGIWGAYGGPFICIPSFYTNNISVHEKKTEKDILSFFIKKNSTSQKTKKEHLSFEPQLIISISGKIIIPAEKINSITSLSVKKS